MRTEFETLFVQKAIEACKNQLSGRVEETKRKFAGSFGIIPDNAEVNVVYVGDLKFTWSVEFGYCTHEFWIVDRKCEKCGNYYRSSGNVTTLQEVGAILLRPAKCEKHNKDK